MKRITAILIPVLLAASSTLFAAQLYRWVDEKGNVEWRDTPPPPAAKKVEQRKVTGSTIETSELPYSLQQAVKRFPVTLWITDCGDTCNKARAHLVRRGVPHTEKNPQSDIEAFKKASGGAMEVPLLQVGSNRLTGYHEPNWDAALDSAGYPRTPVVKLKPQPKPAAAPPPAQAAAGGKPVVRLYTTADCGPQCVEARQALTGRGVPFQEVSVEGPAAAEELRKLSGNTLVPTLHAGRYVIPGFDPTAYNRALDESGFQQAQQ